MKLILILLFQILLISSVFSQEDTDEGSDDESGEDSLEEPIEPREDVREFERISSTESPSSTEAPTTSTARTESTTANSPTTRDAKIGKIFKRGEDEEDEETDKEDSEDNSSREGTSSTTETTTKLSRTKENKEELSSPAPDQATSHQPSSSTTSSPASSSVRESEDREEKEPSSQAMPPMLSNFPPHPSSFDQFINQIPSQVVQSPGGYSSFFIRHHPQSPSGQKGKGKGPSSSTLFWEKRSFASSYPHNPPMIASYNPFYQNGFVSHNHIKNQFASNQQSYARYQAPSFAPAYPAYSPYPYGKVYVQVPGVYAYGYETIY